MSGFFLLGHARADLERRDAVGLELARVADVAELGVDLGHADELLVLGDAAGPRRRPSCRGTCGGRHILASIEPRLVHGGIVVALHDLALERAEVAGLGGRERVVAGENRVLALRVDEVQLHRVGAIDVGVVDEEALLQHHGVVLGEALLGERLRGVEPLVFAVVFQRELFRVLQIHLLANRLDHHRHDIASRRSAPSLQCRPRAAFEVSVSRSVCIDVWKLRANVFLTLTFSGRMRFLYSTTSSFFSS
jgi:hypothetical protein